jgi:hypothetical protein
MGHQDAGGRMRGRQLVLFISWLTNTGTAPEMGNKKNTVIARDWNHMITSHQYI